MGNKHSAKKHAKISYTLHVHQTNAIDLTVKPHTGPRISKISPEERTKSSLSRTKKQTSQTSKNIEDIPSEEEKIIFTKKDTNLTTHVVKNKNTDVKPKRDRIPTQIRNDVWIKYNGNVDSGICYACGIVIERYNAGWHCSHVISDDKGGPTNIENLRSCCRHCNLSMGNCNLYTYIRDKKLTGPGSKNVHAYLSRHNSQYNDKRTNNWGR